MTKQAFNNFLYSEIKAKSFVSPKEIWGEIYNFSKTLDYLQAYEKWLVAQKKKAIKVYGLKKIGDVI